MQSLSTSQSMASEVLSCPLCDYNLTGLTEPRCPECGHIFEWDELTNPARRKYKWFFEHRTILGGLFRTSLAMCRPRRFWTTIRPAYLLSMRRLLLFYVVSLVIAVVPVLGFSFASLAVSEHTSNLRARRFQQLSMLSSGASLDNNLLRFLPPGTTLPANPTYADYNAAMSRLPSVTAYLDQQYPLLNQASFWRDVSWKFSGSHQEKLTFIALLPLPALAGLLMVGVMRQSFSSARINPNHAWRVALYCGNPFSLLPLLIMTFAMQTVVPFLPINQGSGLVKLASLAAYMALPLYHARSIHLATRHYLGIRRAWMVATATFISLMVLGMIVTLYFINLYKNL